MVMPARLPTPLASSPEVPALTASASRGVAASVVTSTEFTAVPKRRSFTAKDKLQILAETDCALGVTSRKVIGLFPEQLRLESVPVLHRLQGRPAGQG